jgi:CRISPR-associated protein Cas1
VAAEALSELRWWRLSAVLVNLRKVSTASAHPLSVADAIVKSVTASVGGREDAGIFFHLRDRAFGAQMREGETVRMDVFFAGADGGVARSWGHGLAAYLSDGAAGRNFGVAEMGDPEERSLDRVAGELGPGRAEGEICMEFLTPFPFRAPKERRTHLTKESLVDAFEKRFTRLFGRETRCDAGEDDFTVLPYYWSYAEIRHPSRSQPGQTQYVNGCVGKLYIKGRFGGLLPFLVLGSELHAGAKLSNGLGYYRLHPRSCGFFEKIFPRKKAVVSVIQDVLDRYDSAAVSLAEAGGLPFDEEKTAEDLARQIADGAYIPSPATAFLIRKKDGEDRLVEQLQFRDLIVQQYVLKTVSEVFDRMFEEGSIGFRKGISREKAVGLIQEAVAEGYRYVVESDIEDFFPSVDHDRLARLLDHCLPDADTRLKDVLLKSVRNGHVLNGVFHPRAMGLAQGAPLSPILANLYLDSFDEQARAWNVRIVRYADDFVILARTRGEAEEVLSRTEAFLGDLGLRINREKTAVRPIEEGFRFLGMTFDGSADTEDPQAEVLKRLRKPLYVTEPFLFLAVNGDAIDVRRDKAVVETIPIRRISEIVVMERAVLSTALIRKCADNQIPLSVLLNTGYYVTTVKPDSKRYYDVSFEHGRKYASLSDTEVLCIAKEFAAGKLAGYSTFFRQRGEGDAAAFAGHLERVIGRIHAAADVQEVRGLEGASAKKVYQHINAFIEPEEFKIRKRERKKPDPINSLLNFGYYLLFSRINAVARAVGLNPYLGFLHSPMDNYESLVCDVEELFRARIDRFVVRLVNLKAVTKNDFSETERGSRLSREAVKKFLNRFEAEMERKSARNPICLKDAVYAQASIIKKWAVEDGPLSFYRWSA